ncbi:MAG TPA: hypothetical protein VMD31_02465 [Opitutaceae bacterium]|nr:hypothetical protein [Opitutaceae bacterium]
MNSPSVSQSSCGLGPRAWMPCLLWGLAAGFAAAAATVLFVLLKLSLLARVALIVLPLVFCLGYILCVVRMLRRVDELQRRIQFEAIGFAFAATVVLAMTVDLLEQAHILPSIHWGWATLAGAMGLLWALGNVIAARRYQ